jgi:hypothetical protein
MGTWHCDWMTRKTIVFVSINIPGLMTLAGCDPKIATDPKVLVLQVPVKGTIQNWQHYRLGARLFLQRVHWRVVWYCWN